ncbi:hypothetical protein B0I37DRAFT_384442 [Chaetomium sp. MPI-CAGE-AT-0009]|nr:hypothetical protein B0I37DRAFT_384442 [Chaetomium sp. MPI-CAGE-AT-0009]
MSIDHGTMGWALVSSTSTTVVLSSPYVFCRLERPEIPPSANSLIGPCLSKNFLNLGLVMARGNLVTGLGCCRYAAFFLI